MKTEILIGLFENLKGTAGLLSFLSGFALFASIWGYSWCKVELSTYTDDDRWAIKNTKQYLGYWTMALKVCVVVLFFTLPISILPSTQDLWRIRIDLVKLELASPENIQLGIDEIGRISKKLECKYLGCEEPQKAVGK